MAQDWYPAAARLVPSGGAENKHGGYGGFVEPGPKLGLVVHSAEGSMSAAMSVLQGPAQLSWQFTNPKTGPLVQHFPAGFHCWASGGTRANVPYVACEHEGVAGFNADGSVKDPLTESQVDNLVGLIFWLSENFGWQEIRRPTSDTDLGASLYEHREMKRFGSSATDCPSGRIPWSKVMALLQEPGGPGPAATQPSFDALRIGAANAMLNKYNFRVTGTNPVGEYVVQLLEKDGSVSQPPSFIAVQIK